MSSRAPYNKGWTACLVVMAGLLAWIVAWYYPTAAAMVDIWERSGTFTHAFLVLPISLWLIWRLRDHLRVIQPRPEPWLLIPMAATAVVWLLGELASVNVVTQFCLVTLLVLAVPMLLGMQLARTLTFPLLFLYFAVPFGEFVMPQLMEWTANITVLLVRVSGVPVYQEGLQFVIPSGNWSVVEACSGVRYLIASICVGVLFAYLNYRSTKRRLLFVLASILVPVVANWIRAYGIVMLGHMSGNKLATGVDHLVYGWFFFGIVIFIMFLIGMHWQEPETPPAIAPVAAPTLATRHMSLALAATLAALVTALGPAAEWLLERSTQSQGVPQLAAGLPAAGGWQADAGMVSAWRPSYKQPTAVFERGFVKGEDHVGVLVAYYRNQNRDNKLISSENVLVRSSDPFWLQEAQGADSVEVEGSMVPVRTTVIRSVAAGGATAGEKRVVVWRWYWVDGAETASGAEGKLRTAWSRINGRGDDSAEIVVYTEASSPERARRALAGYMAANLPALRASLAQARAHTGGSAP